MASGDGDISASPLDRCPVLGICGRSGAGKTTLIEALIPRLLGLGLQVAVVKHGAHNVRVDAPGKDSDRFFRAGADVSLFGEEYFSRRHGRHVDFTAYLQKLCLTHDLILVEGHAGTAVPKIWLRGRGCSSPPDNQGTILTSLGREQAGVDQVFSFIGQWLSRQSRRVPVWGCILIGGKSSRMGHPKHLIRHNNRTWLELAVDKLAPLVDQVVLAGRGMVPDSCSHLARVPDPPGLAGPLAGILGVMRWQPGVSWLVTACDQPDISSKSLQWLLDSRQPGIWAILPDLAGDGQVEPLLAWYDFRCRELLENIADTGSMRISRLADQPGIRHLQPPPDIRSSWHNVNTPSELEAFQEL